MMGDLDYGMINRSALASHSYLPSLHQQHLTHPHPYQSPYRKLSYYFPGSFAQHNSLAAPPQLINPLERQHYYDHYDAHPHHHHPGLLQTTSIERRKIFEGTIGYQIAGLPAELGRLHTPSGSPQPRSYPSSKSKFVHKLVGMGELFKEAKQLNKRAKKTNQVQASAPVPMTTPEWREEASAVMSGQ
mmetsp:Transcript_10841/g.12710  ORF Transcript_10841/g.12710 Transcript_10841/m.12710 type:complete len:187 (-) Transcript_10841:1145-1705(-)